MSDSKKSAYGKAAGDTDFRKKYDLDEYAAKAKVREDAEKEERKLRYEAKLAGKKYYKPLDGTESLTTARNATQDFSKLVGTTTLVPAGAGVGKRGRSAGFYCEACDLTFKDNLQFLEHTNSMQHMRNIGQSGEVKKSSAEEVHARIELLWERIQQKKKDEMVSLKERLEVRREEEDKEREEKRRKRKELEERKRLEKEEALKVKVEYGEDVRIEGEHDEEDMMAALGITGFGAPKNTDPRHGHLGTVPSTAPLALGPGGHRAPLRYLPPTSRPTDRNRSAIQQESNHAMSSSTTSTAAAGLLRRQLKEMQTNKDIPGISCGLVKDSNIFEWEVMLMINDECKYYGGGNFQAYLTFPPTYPLMPPKLVFQKPIPFHPNIYPSGELCISILHPPEEDKFGYEAASERWSPVQTPETILLSVISLFEDPNDESPANVEAARLLREDREGKSKDFRRKVRKCVRESLGED
ncbi:ubiquitin-conjugating enzyme E2 15 [Rhypophila decipiens]|uniref:Ubiquitin-conjugating enzyme E2 15 n=1 Tax=Rhypophila decipiens TaxID=261697 RepID=A0AAN7B8C6_9PEZI|nr:ubiquitin-conjugating enzyme E2 15 [Rhypophila decipiens]